MQTRKQEIEDDALEDRCIFRLTKMKEIVKSYERTLNPHDFCPSTEDICMVPDIRKAIIDGNNEEFDTCADEVMSRLPRLTSPLLEERIAKISALLPYKKRSDNVLSLAIAWVKCGSCNASPMHATDALRHYCSIPQDYFSEKPIGEATFDAYVRGQAWCGQTATLRFSQPTSSIARGLILDCGDDSKNITWKEMDAKFHRFVRYECGNPIVQNWREMVGHTLFCRHP